MLHFTSIHSVIHFGQSSFSHPLLGHFIEQEGFGHFTSQTECFGEPQFNLHLGGSQTGSH